LSTRQERASDAADHGNDPRPARLEKAEHHCRRALMLDPALPEGHLARAFILWSPAKNFQHAEAIAALQQVLVARPNHERAHNRMSSICLHIGRLEEAHIAHERAQRATSETRSGNLEWFYLMSGDYARAEETTAAWLRDRPASIYARVTHALPALFTGDLDVAEERLAAVLKQFPEEPLIGSLQGILFARRDQPDLALQCVRKALESRVPLATRTTPIITSPACMRFSGKLKKRWRGWNAVSTPVGRAGLFLGLIHISKTCEKYPLSND